MDETVILLSWVFRIRDQSFPPLKLGLFQAFGRLGVVLPTFSHVALKYPHQTSGPCLVLCSGAGPILQTKLWFPTSFLVPKHLFWVQLDDKKKSVVESARRLSRRRVLVAKSDDLNWSCGIYIVVVKWLWPPHVCLWGDFACAQTHTYSTSLWKDKILGKGNTLA